MKVALIAPRDLLEFAERGDMHFIVPANARITFFRPLEKYKMLDNGTYEAGKPVEIEELFTLARQMHANEIVLPDILRDKKATMRLTIEALEHSKPKGLKYAAVPQGKDPEEFIECYHHFSVQDEIDVLCFPIWLQKHFNARPMIINYLMKKKLFAPKQHHLIGLDSFGELYCYTPGLIRSVDTSLPFSAGMRRIVLSDCVTYKGPRVNLAGCDPRSRQRECIDKNITRLLEVASSA